MEKKKTEEHKEKVKSVKDKSDSEYVKIRIEKIRKHVEKNLQDKRAKKDLVQMLARLRKLQSYEARSQ